jgi:arginine exporter protein ArgO
MRTAFRRYRGDIQTRAQLSRPTPARAYLSLVALTAINPATVVTFAAVVVGRSSSEGGPSWPAVALFALGAFGASAIWQLLLAGGGSLLGRMLRTRRGQLRISLCSAFVMLGLAVGVLLS